MGRFFWLAPHIFSRAAKPYRLITRIKCRFIKGFAEAIVQSQNCGQGFFQNNINRRNGNHAGTVCGAPVPCSRQASDAFLRLKHGDNLILPPDFYIIGQYEVYRRAKAPGT